MMINEIDPNQQKVQAIMLKFLKRKQNIQPNKDDGFYSTETNTGASDGSNGTPGIGN